MALAWSKPEPRGAYPAMAFVADEMSLEVARAVFAEQNWPDEAVQEGGVAAALRHPHEGEDLPVMLVDVSGSTNAAADIAALAATKSAQRLIAIGDTNDVALFRDLIASGAADYLVKPLNRHSLMAALLAAPQNTVTKPANAGRTVAFVGARGGVGASTMAANIAWIVANEHKRKVALLDLDLQFGTAALSLDIQPGRGLREALERPSRIDSLFLERAMEKHGDRLYVLAGEEPLTDDLSLDPSAPTVLLHELRGRFDTVIVDLPRSAGIAERQALAAATHIVLVMDLSLPAMRDGLRLMAMARDAAPDAAIFAVAHGTGSLAQAEFERGLGRKLDAVVTSDRKAMAAAATAGKPLAMAAPGSKAVTALRELTAAVAGAAPARRGLAFWRRAS